MIKLHKITELRVGTVMDLEVLADSSVNLIEPRRDLVSSARREPREATLLGECKRM